MRLLSLAMLVNMLPGCGPAPNAPAAVTPEPPDNVLLADRPRLHFSSPVGWLNDPNGLVYLEGEYHLFYQHHPASLVWGPMHWGHAVSADLLTWQHLPIALAPDGLGQIFSGSAVIDHANSAGFGPGAMVAIFTHAGDQQAQSLAYSLDRGRTWAKYAGNPVLPPPAGQPDFRDPRVFWHADSSGGQWVMLLAVGQEIWFYTSPDLKAWTKTGVFGAGHGAHSGVWECPELVSLPIDGGPARRWVLLVGVQQGAPAGGSGTQYFVGAFDGATFTSDDPPATVRWADYGGDFYAAQAWGDAPDGRTLTVAWMNNWDYARDTPASTWRGAMSLPRELGLARDGDGLALVQRPARELHARRGEPRAYGPITLADTTLPLDPAPGQSVELIASFSAAAASATRFGLRVRVGDGEATIVAYDREGGQLSVDRGRSGRAVPGFAAPQLAPLEPRDGRITLHLVLDVASLELFADDGRVAITSQIFPSPASLGLELFAEGGAVTVEALTVWALE